ncbi:hypothetical protein D9M71_137030 [compost metagenome]
MLTLFAMIAFCISVCRLLRQPPEELEQAALLPFADDPEAAARMTRATGRRCERVVEPLPETALAPGFDRFTA